MADLGSEIDKWKEYVGEQLVEEDNMDKQISRAVQKKDKLVKEVADLELLTSLKAESKERRERLFTKKRTLSDLQCDVVQLTNKKAKVFLHGIANI